MLLGVYHPRLLLITTPSYTYNARFTAPHAPSSARRGYLDPTGRTNRIFRHDDHKFEWTTEEFRVWCEDTAHEWGYEAQISGVGRSAEPDPWNREEELGEASFVASFRKTNLQEDQEREHRGRKFIERLSLSSKPHELYMKYSHLPDPAARKPKSLAEISNNVEKVIDEYRDAFIRLEEIWFWPEISASCGGWIELLVRATDGSDRLKLLREGEAKNKQSTWRIQRIGRTTDLASPGSKEGESSPDYIPIEWEPEENKEIESLADEDHVLWNDTETNTEDERSYSYNWSHAFRLEDKVDWDFVSGDIEEHDTM